MIRKTALALLFIIVALGCGKEKPDPPPPKPNTISANPGTGIQPALVKKIPVLDRTLAMGELRTIHATYFGAGLIPPPGSVEEFKELQQTSPKLYQAVKEGHYVIFWKANQNQGDAILAYWNEVPTKGGPVLLVNGEINQNMSPEEFKKAPKAGKAP